jgi:hypothetical protein
VAISALKSAAFFSAIAIPAAAPRKSRPPTLPILPIVWSVERVFLLSRSRPRSTFAVAASALPIPPM